MHRGAYLLPAAIAFVISAELSTASLAQGGPCGDLDSDGYLAGSGCTTGPIDCNDQNAVIHPGATEVCNGVDDNCDGVIDEGCNATCPNFGLTRRVLVTSGGSEGRIAAADRSWAMIVNSDLAAFPEIATRIDLRGQELSPQTVFTGGFPKYQEVCWTGTEMASSWSVLQSSGYPPGVFFRRLGPWGTPESGTVNFTTEDSGAVGVVWTGYEYAAFWVDFYGALHDGEYMARLDSGSNVLDQIYLDPVKDQYATFAWNGSGYGWAPTRIISGYEDIYFAALSAAGVQTGPMIRLTDHSGQPTSAYAASAVLVARNAGQGYGVIWQDNRTGTRQLWFALLQPDGTIVTPPGQVKVTNTTKSIGQQYHMTWSGAEFMAVWTNLDASAGVFGKIYGSRISSTGTVLETAQITAGPGDDEPRIAWNGKSYGLAVEEQPITGPPNVYFVGVDCNCTTDADHDGILPCSGGDCDDSDSAVGTGKPEICNDGKDNNCDGFIDCNDSTCVQNGSPPLEIGNVRFSSGKATIAWNGDTKATGYDVARGVLSDLRDMQNFRWTNCFASRITQTSTTDSENPKAGFGFYYMVRGRAKTCLLGTWGSSLADGTLHGCP